MNHGGYPENPEEIVPEWMVFPGLQKPKKKEPPLEDKPPDRKDVN